jgi:hypothetical protein
MNKSRDVYNDGKFVHYYTVNHFGGIIRTFSVKSKNIESIKILVDGNVIYNNNIAYENETKNIQPLHFGIPICYLYYSNITFEITTGIPQCYLVITRLYIDEKTKNSYTDMLNFDNYEISDGVWKWKSNKKVKL